MSEFAPIGFADVLYRSKHNFLALMITMIFVLVFASIISLVWGILVLLAAILIGTGLMIIVLDRFKGGRQDAIFIFCIVFGVVFLMLHLAGVELGTVDISGLPGLQGIHDFFSTT